MNENLIVEALKAHLPAMSISELADAWLMTRDNIIKDGTARQKLANAMNDYLFATNKVAIVSQELRARGLVM